MEVDCSLCRNIKDILFKDVAVIEAEDEIRLHCAYSADPHRVVDIGGSIYRNTFADGKLCHRVELIS